MSFPTSQYPSGLRLNHLMNGRYAPPALVPPPANMIGVYHAPQSYYMLPFFSRNPLFDSNGNVLAEASTSSSQIKETPVALPTPPTSFPTDSQPKVSKKARIEVQRRMRSMKNTGKLSPLRGIFWRSSSKSWLAKITLKNKAWHLGCYKDKEAAARGLL